MSDVSADVKRAYQAGYTRGYLAADNGSEEGIPLLEVPYENPIALRVCDFAGYSEYRDARDAMNVRNGIRYDAVTAPNHFGW